MNMTSYGVLLLLIVLITTVAGFGAYAGYTVSGIEQTNVSGGVPGILGIISWVWDSIEFMFHMITFQVDGMPAFISGIFLIMSLMGTFLIINLLAPVISSIFGRLTSVF